MYTWLLGLYFQRFTLPGIPVNAGGLGAVPGGRRRKRERPEWCRADSLLTSLIACAAYFAAGVNIRSEI